MLSSVGRVTGALLGSNNLSQLLTCGLCLASELVLA
jgi:hypothetical protein